jgi:hypothetical protein
MEMRKPTPKCGGVLTSLLLGLRRVSRWRDFRIQERGGSHRSETFDVGFKRGLKIGDGYAKISALRGEKAGAQSPDQFF